MDIKQFEWVSAKPFSETNPKISQSQNRRNDLLAIKVDQMIARHAANKNRHNVKNSQKSNFSDKKIKEERTKTHYVEPPYMRDLFQDLDSNPGHYYTR